MSPLSLLPLPSTLPAWRVAEVKRLRNAMASDERAREAEGVRRWRSNGAVIPTHVYKDAFVVCPPTQEAAYDREVSESIAAYRRRMENHVPDAEEMFEMRAAFGPGQTVVNVLTGQRFRT